MKRKKAIKIILIIFLILAFLVGVVPFLLPIRTLEGTQPAAALADADSQFVEVNGLDVHYKKRGVGEPVLILLHGFGASTFSWREVIAPLSNYGTVIAYDRPAFGLTERPLNGDWQGLNPYSYEGNLSLLIGLMDALGIDKAYLAGNSAGGTLATLAALEHPERVTGLVLVDAAIYQVGPSSKALQWVFNTPQMDRLGVLLSRSLSGSQGDQFLGRAWHDPSKITDEMIEGYRKPLQVENWDAALWEHTRSVTDPGLAERLTEISVPTLVITGDDDRIVPTELSIRLSEEIPSASLVIIENCGHVPQEECPEPVLTAIVHFITD